MKLKEFINTGLVILGARPYHDTFTTHIDVQDEMDVWIVGTEADVYTKFVDYLSNVGERDTEALELMVELFDLDEDEVDDLVSDKNYAEVRKMIHDAASAFTSVNALIRHLDDRMDIVYITKNII